MCALNMSISYVHALCVRFLVRQGRRTENKRERQEMYKKEFMQKYVSPRKIPSAMLFYGHSFSVDYMANLVLSVL
ncbi:MAG: hypothetical protein K2O85_08425, partial [Helicobacter sp.]|nr:hypothetical protein [Helicobacter sp.]